MRKSLSFFRPKKKTHFSLLFQNQKKKKLSKRYSYDPPTGAFPLEVFKQAFAAVQASVVHLQGVETSRRFALVPMGPPLLFQLPSPAAVGAERGRERGEQGVRSAGRGQGRQEGGPGRRLVREEREFFFFIGRERARR